MKDEPIFLSEEAARAHLERLLWPDGPVCPHCGSVDNATALKTKTESTRPGVYKCRDCEAPFTVTVGTVYESSHIPLAKWVYATHLMNASKKGISALQLQRMLGLGSYRTAWFMAMRIREGMRDAGTLPPLGGEGKVVEADETYYGRVKDDNLKPNPKRKRQPGKHKDQRPKRAVVALVERGGTARVFHVARADKETVAKIVTQNVDPASRLHTDESNLYVGADAHTATHETVKHTAGEYVRGDVHTNSAEGFFGVFKKGMTGVYQHCDEKYLGRYLDEFAFRHNTRVKLGFNDKDRAALAIKGAAGKRLTLRHPQGRKAS